MEKYRDDVDEADQWTNKGIYKVSSETVKHAVNKSEDLLEEEFADDNHYFKDFQSELNSQIRKFSAIDEAIDIEEEYKAEPDIKSFIYRQRNEIFSDIEKYRKNKDIMSDLKEVINRLEKELDELI